jgi:hypothetical protein
MQHGASEILCGIPAEPEPEGGWGNCDNPLCGKRLGPHPDEMRGTLHIDLHDVDDPDEEDFLLAAGFAEYFARPVLGRFCNKDCTAVWMNVRNLGRDVARN